MQVHSYVPVEEELEIKNLRDDIYKLTFRKNITHNEEKKCYIFDQYSTIVVIDGSEHLSKEEIDDAVNAKYDAYLELAKLEDAEHEKSERVVNCKRALSNSDYQILKNLENYSLGLPLPYDYSALIAKRQSLRDTINNLTEASAEETELEQARSVKITEMCAICQTTITNGIDYDGAHYRLNTTDQINLMSLNMLAQTGQPVPYHADGEVCRMFTPEEFIPLVQQGIKWITYHTTYFNLLKNQINHMENIDSIKAVTYGMELQPAYQAIINTIIGDTNE